MTSTRNYPKVRTVDPPEPEYLYGSWAVRITPGHEAVIKERSIYRSTEDEPLATQQRVDYQWSNNYVEVCTFTRAYLRARKLRVQAMTPADLTEPQEGTQ